MDVLIMVALICRNFCAVSGVWRMYVLLYYVDSWLVIIDIVVIKLCLWSELKGCVGGGIFVGFCALCRNRMDVLVRAELLTCIVRETIHVCEEFFAYRI